MTTILLIGTGPLFSPELQYFSGQSFRTWHFARPLIEAGHQVELVVLPTEGSSHNNNARNELFSDLTRGEFPYRMIQSTDPTAIIPALQQIVDSKHFDAMVAVNLNAAFLVCQLETDAPLWVDLNGYTMGEAQAKCKVYQSDSYLMHFWTREKLTLRRGDRFSAVSYKQMLAVLAELGTVGRLNRFTFNYHFATVTPNAAAEEFLEPASYPFDHKYRGEAFPSDAFAILWSGGFNTWTDPRTLAAGLSLAMEQNPKIHFVATGAAIPGHDEHTYRAFQEEMEKTGLFDRCHMLGWVPARELFALHRECDLGINIDSLNYETVFGARNRLTNMMAAGLPILTTLGTELSEIIKENRLGYVVTIENADELSNTILRAAKNLNELRQFAQKAKRFCIEHFSYAETTKALVNWAANPQRAPDNEEKIRRNPGVKKLTSIALNQIEEELVAFERVNLTELLQQRYELDSIRQKKLYRLYKKIF